MSDHSVSGPLAGNSDININIPSADFSTPFIFLTPEHVHTINLATYIHIAATGVMIWDFLDNLRNDFTMPVTSKTRIPTIMYFVIRLTMVAYCLGRAAILTAPVGNCGQLAQILSALLTINVICVTGLCYLRVIVVYSKNRYIVCFFGLTWLSVVAMALIFFKTFGATFIPNTSYCHEVIQGPFGVPTLAALALNDTLIYFAIAYRIHNIFQTYDFGQHLKKKLVIVAFGASLPTVGSKVVLLESQLYCLIIVISKACVLAVVSINEEKYAMFLVCHLVLTTILVSRVYRELTQARYHPIQRNITEFQTENLTSAEFVENISTSIHQRISRISMKPVGFQSNTTAIVGSSRQTENIHETPSNRLINYPEGVYVQPCRDYLSNERLNGNL